MDLDSLEQRAKESLSSDRIQEAVELWSRALEQREQVVREGDEGSYDPDLCRCLDHLGRALRKSGEHEQAEEVHRRALSIRRSHLASDHPLVAESYFLLAEVDLLRGQPLEAEQKLVGVVEVRRKHFGQGHVDSLAGLGALLDFYVRAERPIAITALAESWLSEARETPGSALGESAFKIARAYRSLGMEEEAGPLLAEAERNWVPSASDDDPEIFDLFEHSLASSLALGRMEEAKRLLLCLLQRERATHGPTDLKVIFRLKQLSDFMDSQGRPSEAISFLEQCLEATVSALQEDPPSFDAPCPVQMLESLIGLDARVGRPEQVEARLQQLVALRTTEQDPSEKSSLRALLRLDELARSADSSNGQLLERFRESADSLSVLCLRAGRDLESRDLHHLLIEHLENVAPSDFPRALHLRERLLGQLLSRERLQDAERVLHGICERRAEHFESDPIGLARSLEQRASLLRTLGRFAEAAESLDQALAKRTAGSPGEDDRAGRQEHVEMLRLDLQILSQLHLEAGHVDRATNMLARLATSWREESPRDEKRELECLETLTSLYLDEGRLEDLETTLERVRDLRRSQSVRDPQAQISNLELLAAVKCVLGKERQAETIFESLPELEDATQIPARLSRRWLEMLDQHGKLDRAPGMLGAALNAYTDTSGVDPLVLEPAVLDPVALDPVVREEGREENGEATGVDPGTRTARPRRMGLWAAGWLELKGDFDRARLFEVETCYREALEIRRRMLGDRHGEVGRSLGKLAALYADEGRFEQALDLFRRAVDIQGSCPATGPASMVETLSGLAEVCSDLGLAAEAEAHYRAALERSEQAYGVDRVETAKVLVGLARVLREGGRPAESEPLMRRAFDIFASKLSDDHPLLATTALGWAEILCDLRSFESAEPLLRRALAIRLQHLNASDPDIGRIHNQLGLLELGCDRLDEAQREFERASTILRPLANSEPLEWAVLLSNLAELELRRGGMGSAIELFQEAADIRERGLGPKNSEVGLAWCRLARAHELAGEPEKAERLLERAVEVLEDQADRPLDTAAALDQQANLWCRSRKFELAEPLYRRSLEIREVQAGSESREAAYSHFGLATTHRFMGQREKAQQHFIRCKEIWRSASEYGLLAEVDRRWSRPFQEVSP